MIYLSTLDRQDLSLPLSWDGVQDLYSSDQTQVACAVPLDHADYTSMRVVIRPIKAVPGSTYCSSADAHPPLRNSFSA